MSRRYNVDVAEHPSVNESTSQTAVDLTTCDREPIHIPGAIQPHGMLLAVRAVDEVIVQASESTLALIGRSARDLLGLHLAELIDSSSHLEVDRLLRRDLMVETRTAATVASAAVSVGGKPFKCIAHRSGELLIVELEPDRSSGSSAQDLVRSLQLAMAGTTSTTTLSQLAQVAADQVRDLARFDRVMVYRFDAEWNGAVIAEAKRDELEPFLGLHYPASDIPVQARALYARNRLRFITDRDYTPSPLVPERNPLTGAPLDLSQSVLRSVSPVHIEYLRNMGVRASMSVSILDGDRLWGLIACHHYAGPRFVTYEVRRLCELVGELISLQLVAKQDSEDLAYSSRMRLLIAELAGSMDRGTDLAESLTQGSPSLRDLFDVGGAAVINGDHVFTVGKTPTDLQIRELADWLDREAMADNELFQTDHLSHQYPTAEPYHDVVSGLLAVSLTKSRRHYLLWFRGEVVRSVSWAGDPAKSVMKGEDGVRLSPRGSFALWRQTVRHRSAPWTGAEQAAALDLRRSVVDRILRRAEELAHLNVQLLRSRDEAEESRKAAESANRVKDQFLATLSHELRTPLNAILGWANLLSRGARSEDDISEGLAIIERNARAQNQLIEDLLDVSRIVTGKLRLEAAPVDLAQVVDAAIASVRVAADAKGLRLRVEVAAHAGQVQADPVRLQQVVWNLLSNAVKFTPKGGDVRVRLSRVDSQIQLVVKDSGMGIAPELLPHVFERFRQAEEGAARKYGGLGLGLAIVKHLVELHGGTVSADSEGVGQGASFTVRLPLIPVRRASSGRVDPADVGAAPAPPRRVRDCPPELAGIRVLVVEDEADSRTMIVRALEDCGAITVSAASVAEAMTLLREMVQPPEVVISDIGMPGEDGFAFIQALRGLPEERGSKVPAIALTAYASNEDRRRILAAGFQTHLAKPVTPPELVAVIANLSTRTAADRSTTA